MYCKLAVDCKKRDKQKGQINESCMEKMFKNFKRMHLQYRFSFHANF